MEENKKFKTWMSSLVRSSKAEGMDPLKTLVDQWIKEYKWKEVLNTRLEGVALLEYLEKNFPSGEETFFRLRMVAQLGMCRFDDNYMGNRERWTSLVAADLNAGIPPRELDAWQMSYLKFDAPMYKKSAQAYNSGEPLDPKIPIQTFFESQQRPAKYKIGFLAGAWQCHTTTYLCRGLLRCLNPDRFDVYTLVGTGADREDDICRTDMKQITTMKNMPRIGVDTSVTVEAFKELELDFLVDLLGPGEGTRGAAFLYRPAKVQLNWMAHPGTCGNKGIQYIVVDPILAPLQETNDWFVEKRAYLPKSYFNGDHAAQFPHLRHSLRGFTSEKRMVLLHGARPIPLFFKDASYMDIVWQQVLESHEEKPVNIRGYRVWNGDHLPEGVQAGYEELQGLVATSRKQQDLPDDVVVFSSFNTHNKHDVETVVLWLQILDAVPESVLWVSAYPSAAKKGLIQSFMDIDMNKKRLIMLMEGFTSKELYIRRLALVDLCLDPLVCNGHTSTLDAIYAACPVLCLLGQSFQSRVSASMNHVLEIPGLITHSVDDYRKMGIYLGQNPAALADLRNSIEDRKNESPLFDVRQFSSDFEDLLDRMYDEFMKNPNKPEEWAELPELEAYEDWKYFEVFDKKRILDLYPGDYSLSTDEEMPSPTPGPSSGAAPMQYIPPRQSLSPVPMDVGSPPQQGHFLGEARLPLFPRISPKYDAPTAAAQDDYYIGQRISHLSYLSGALDFCLEKHLDTYFEDLCVGPIQVSQFVARLFLYLKQGLPKFPQRPTNFWNGYFTSADGLLHLNSDHYFLTRSMIGDDGFITEPRQVRKEQGEMRPASRLLVEKCHQCEAGEKARKVTTLRDVHGPEIHTWKGRSAKPKDCPQCPQCGIPKVLFLSHDEELEHEQAHDNNKVRQVCEACRQPADDEGATEDRLRYHPFRANLFGLQDPNYLQTEVQRYCDLMGQPSSAGLHRDGFWLFNRGQRMMTYVWLRKGVKNVLSWMRENVGSVASSGHVVRQFLALLDFNLHTIGCPIFPNLQHMDPDARKLFCKAQLKFEDSESYEYLCRLFDDAGDLDETNWKENSSMVAGESYCKLCNESYNIRNKDFRKKMNEDHLLPPTTETCAACNFAFQPNFIASSDIKNIHSQRHASMPGWKEVIVDGQRGDDNAADHIVYTIEL